jgi:hypothetical protein
MNFVWVFRQKLKSSWLLFSKSVLRPAIALVSCMVIATFPMLLPDAVMFDVLKLCIWIIVFRLMFALMAGLGVKYMKSLGV